MNYGYNNKILIVNLSDSSVKIENPGEQFFRKYMGGSALGVYYCLREIPKGADPLGPDNVLVFAPGVLTGAPIPCASRYTVTAKSPLTGGIGDAQAGGWWAPELKWAGFDAIVVKGKSKKPVYLWIKNGDVEIREASHLWGKNIGDTEDLIQQELKDTKIRVSGIGPGGENLVKYACIINEKRHAAGRTGMGAVMGSKNLKAVAVRGEKSDQKYFNPDYLKGLTKIAIELIPQNPVMDESQKLGTISCLTSMHLSGGLPTRNFQSGVFENYENISAEKLHETIFVKSGTCYHCPVFCKRIVKAEEPYHIDPDYGGPEYETTAALGSYLCVDDLAVISKGNELCNKYTLDTISTGASIAFAMECFENGLLSLEETDGLELKFGNKEVVVPLIEKIAYREGIGNLLADGPREAAKKIGANSYKYSIDVKGNPLPAHMPRVKKSLALAYAVIPFGADHCSTTHDPAFTSDAPDLFTDRVKSFGLSKNVDMDILDLESTRLVYYTQQYYALMDSLAVCIFGFGEIWLFDMEHLVRATEAVTGWKVSSWELMKVGERRTNLMRIFNAREGFGAKDDTLPDRLFEPLIGGPTEGKSIDRIAFEKAKRDYYGMAGWDIETGNPTAGKLKELGLEEWIKSYQ